jgi:hypothetical protein
MNRYIMFERGICKKYQLRDEKFPELIDEGNLIWRLVSSALPYLSQPPAAMLLSSDIFFYCFTSTSERFRVSHLINHVTLRIKVKKKYSEWIWRFEAREGKKYNSHANTLAAERKNEINPNYENTRKIHRLLTNQYQGFLYKV